MDDKQWAIIGRGKVGWHAEAGCGLTSSSGGTFEGYLANAAEGALIYDAEAADYDVFSSLVIQGPMCKPSLEHNEYPEDPSKRWGWGSFTYITTDTYESLLRRVPGVRLGRVVNGEVCWRDD